MSSLAWERAIGYQDSNSKISKEKKKEVGVEGLQIQPLQEGPPFNDNQMNLLYCSYQLDSENPS